MKTWINRFFPIGVIETWGAYWMGDCDCLFTSSDLIRYSPKGIDDS